MNWLRNLFTHPAEVEYFKDLKRSRKKEIFFSPLLWKLNAIFLRTKLKLKKMIDFPKKGENENSKS